MNENTGTILFYVSIGAIVVYLSTRSYKALTTMKTLLSTIPLFVVL
jgi:hypothetical protein